MSSVTCVDCRGILAKVEGGSIKNLLESLKKSTYALHPFSEYPCVFALEKKCTCSQRNLGCRIFFSCKYVNLLYTFNLIRIEVYYVSKRAKFIFENLQVIFYEINVLFCQLRQSMKTDRILHLFIQIQIHFLLHKLGKLDKYG